MRKGVRQVRAHDFQRTASEGDVKKTVAEYLTAARIVFVRFNNMSAFSKKNEDGWQHYFRKVPEEQLGAPDFFVFLQKSPRPPLPVAVETKRPKVKRLRDAQVRWRDRWQGIGGTYLEVRTLDDLVGGLRNLGA